MADPDRFLVDPGRSIRQVMAGIGHARGLALVVDDGRRLLGTVTDGDIRRAILAGVDLEQPIGVLLEQPRPQEYASPLTAPVGTPDVQLLRMMAESEVRHVPLLNDSGQVEDVAVLDDLVSDYELPLTAVVMAGGLGTRLRPLTDDLPKPMLPVGDRPLLERIIDQLRQAGIRRVNLTTHFEGQRIAQYFGDGSDFGVDIRYVNEDQPLGTAGALSLLEASDEPLLVINGDVLTGVDFAAMLHFHREHRADMTVGVAEYGFRVPYGVIETDGADVVAVIEKPVVKNLINAGIYLLGSGVVDLIPNGLPYDMPDLITHLVTKGRRVVSFPILEYWLDIGQAADYRQAQDDVRTGRLSS